MRVAGLVFSLLVTVSLTAMALTYVLDYVGQQRIHVQGSSDSFPGPKPYHSYGSRGNTNPDTAQTAKSDPHHQRYYSASEGWTYYSLPR